MNVRQLMEHLYTLDPNSEIMVDAPLNCAEGQTDNPSHLVLPVRCVQRGTFPANGKPFAIVVGNLFWGQNQPVEYADV